MGKIGNIAVKNFARNIWQDKKKGMSYSYIVHLGWEDETHEVSRYPRNYERRAKTGEKSAIRYWKLLYEKLYTNAELAQKFLSEGGRYRKWFDNVIEPKIVEIEKDMHRRINERMSEHGKRAIRLYNSKRVIKASGGKTLGIHGVNLLPMNIEYGSQLEDEGEFDLARLYLNPYEFGATVYNIVQHFAILARNKIEECILAGAEPPIKDSTKRLRKWRGNPEQPPFNETGTFARAVKYEIRKIKG